MKEIENTVICVFTDQIRFTVIFRFDIMRSFYNQMHHFIICVASLLSLLALLTFKAEDFSPNKNVNFCLQNKEILRWRTQLHIHQTRAKQWLYNRNSAFCLVRTQDTQIGTEIGVDHRLADRQILICFLSLPLTEKWRFLQEPHSGRETVNSTPLLSTRRHAGYTTVRGEVKLFPRLRASTRPTSRRATSRIPQNGRAHGQTTDD